MHYEVCTEIKRFSRIDDILLKENLVGNNIQLEVITEYEEKEVTMKLHLTDRIPYKVVQKELLGSRVINCRRESSFYPLRPVTRKELYKIRMSGKPSIVYKKGDLLFVGEIPTSIGINCKSTSLGKHLCSDNCTKVCQGCPRTSALTVAYQQRIGKTFAQAVFASWRIEKHDFVEEGLEAFNMGRTNDAFLVLKCNHFSSGHSINEHRTPTNNQRLSLAAFYWDDFDGSIGEMRKRIHENLVKYGEGASD